MCYRLSARSGFVRNVLDRRYVLESPCLQSEDGQLFGEEVCAEWPVRGQLVAGHSPRTPVCHRDRCFFFGGGGRSQNCEKRLDESVLRFEILFRTYVYCTVTVDF